jgi:O-antigen/teichoic acid export membrane protein
LIAGAAGAGPGAIRLLYGDTFARSGTVLLVLLVALVALPVWSVSAAVLAAHRDAVSPLVAGGAGALLNVGLALWLVPRDGAVGAAAASAGGQLVAIVLMHHLVGRRVGPMTWDGASLVRSGVVAVGTGAVAWLPSLWLDGALGVALGLLGGAAVLVVLGTGARPLPLADVSWLATSLGGRLGERAATVLTRVAR